VPIDIVIELINVLKLPVEPTGSEDPEVGKRGFKEGHVEKKVNTDEIA